MHIEKFKSPSVGGVLAHIIRKKTKDNLPRHYSNENVDTSKSYLNYRLDNNDSVFEKYKSILSREDVKLQKRKDVNTFCSVCLTLPHDVKPDDEQNFFKYAFEFLKNRYAPYNNVVVAEVHKDETRPHLHFVFVPLVADKKHNRLKVSAKELVNRDDLKTLHKDCSDYIAEHLSYRVSILNNEALERNANNDNVVDVLENLMQSNLVKNMKVDDYKKAKDLIKKVIALCENCKTELEQNNKEVDNLIDEYNELVDEYNKLDDEIAELLKRKKELYDDIHTLEGEDFKVEYMRDNDYLEL